MTSPTPRVRHLAIHVAMLALASFNLAQAQTEAVIHSFQSTSAFDGAGPFGGLVADKEGALYGTTTGGGKYRGGTVYKLSPPAAQGGDWKQTILYPFSGISGDSDGASPSGGIVLATSGKIYGTTVGGGHYGDGAVFELSPPTQLGNPWTEAVIYSFYGSTDAAPYGLSAGPGGRLYGTIQHGGRYGNGAVYVVSPPSEPGGPWSERTIYSFNNTGAVPQGLPSPVVVDASGVVYGTSSLISANNAGVVFKLTPPPDGKGAWQEEILHSFTGQPGDGSLPFGGVIFDSTGSLYGNTFFGGQFGQGAVYRLSPPADPGGPWTEQILYSFRTSGDAANPVASLVFDGTGALYGVSQSGGSASCGENYYYCGTAFKVIPPSTGGAWTDQVLHDFSGGNDGAYVATPLLVIGASVYGTTLEGGTGLCINQNGPAGCGTVFEITQP